MKAVPAPDAVPDAMAVAMARQVAPAALASHGAGVPLAGAALLLARRLFVPEMEVYFEGRRSPAGLSRGSGVPPKGAAPGFVTQQRIIDWHLRGRVDFQFVRPLQVDPWGAVNVSSIGDPAMPDVRVHGMGVADAMVLVGRVCLYVLEHSPRVFVPTLDFVTAPGHAGGGGWRDALGVPGGGPAAVVTPLGVLDFSGPGCRMRLRAVFEGVTAADVADATGFALPPAGVAPEVVVPTADELAVLEEVDPRGERRTEFERGARRRASGGRSPRSPEPETRGEA